MVGWAAGGWDDAHTEAQPSEPRTSRAAIRVYSGSHCGARCHFGGITSPRRPPMPEYRVNLRELNKMLNFWGR